MTSSALARDLDLAVLPAHEAADRNSAARRIAAALKAGRDVTRDRYRLERETVRVLLDRLNRLKGELARVLLSVSSTDFRRFTASSLIEKIDVLIAQAELEIVTDARRAYTKTQDLGLSSVEEPLQSARLTLTAAPGVDRALVTRASDVTGDLLSVPMRQFRNNLAARVRRVAIAGEGTQDQIRGLSTAIEDAGFDGAAYKAERQVRTELGRVFTESNFDRMVQLADRMPFIRKAWRSTRDNRTRTGHVEAAKTYGRGNGIKVRDLFVVNVHQEFPGKPVKFIGQARLRFPIDPNTEPAGRLAAATTIMCRCSSFIDFDLADLRASSTGGRSGYVTVTG